MANRIPVKAIYSGTDVTSLGEYTSTDKIDGAYLADGTVTAAKLAADTATQAELDAVANAAMPKAGGAFTGAVTTNSTIDGRDVAADGVLATNALPKAGGTMTGAVIGSTDTDASNTGNVTLDFSANQNFVLTLQGATTLVNPSTETVGQSGFITFIQDGTGGRVVSLGTDYETAGAAGITLSTAASATDIVPYVVVAANRILLGTPQLAFA
tara:strand:- start:123 stop:758 length:636 start_codon:yes stop_codon:yes gene_type:complete